jgi:nucleotide-binding universal stress UspA family protein
MSYAYNVNRQRAEDPGDRVAAAEAIYPLLPPDEVAALLAATQALRHLHELDNELPDLAADLQAGGLAADMLREAAGLDLTFVQAPGDPVAGLLRIAGEVHADLIVVGGSAATPHRLAGWVGQRLAGRRRESVIVVVPPQSDARRTYLEE